MRAGYVAKFLPSVLGFKRVPEAQNCRVQSRQPLLVPDDVENISHAPCPPLRFGFGFCFQFSHLLKPIRDLALNWDIDIANALEDYLDELEGLTIALGPELAALAVTEPTHQMDELISTPSPMHAHKTRCTHQRTPQTFGLTPTDHHTYMYHFNVSEGRVERRRGGGQR